MAVARWSSESWKCASSNQAFRDSSVLTLSMQPLRTVRRSRCCCCSLDRQRMELRRPQRAAKAWRGTGWERWMVVWCAKRAAVWRQARRRPHASSFGGKSAASFWIISSGGKGRGGEGGVCGDVLAGASREGMGRTAAAPLAYTILLTGGNPFSMLLTIRNWSPVLFIRLYCRVAAVLQDCNSCLSL